MARREGARSPGETPRTMIVRGHVDRITGVLYAVNVGVAN